MSGKEEFADEGGEFSSSHKETKEFTPSEGLTSAEAEALLAEHGRNELEEKSTPKWLVYLQQLYGPMPIMIWIAIAIEIGIQNWMDMGILLAIQFINATISWYESTKAADAVAALKASLKPIATAKRDDQWQKIDAALLVPGDLVMLGAGSAVPADCLVNDGQCEVDQAALTGESLPVTMFKGDSVKMGSTVVRGEVEGTVEFTGKNTFFGKTATMLQGVDGLGHLQKILLTVMLVLLVVSFTLCFIVLFYLLFGKDIKFKEALSFTVVLLVASIPIAIEIVTTTTLAIGSRKLSREGAIVSRLSSIEELAGMNMLCSDKTGTLTMNKMVIQDDCPTFSPGIGLKEVLQYAAMAAKWREPPKDALDTMVLGAADIDALDREVEMLDYMPFDPTVKRTEGTLKDKKTGQEFKTTKGAPHIILALCWNKDEIKSELDFKVLEYGTRGIRCLAVAKTDDQGRWNMQGILTFLDPPRHDTRETIERALHYGVDVKMITGDHTVIAKETARQLGMGVNIQDADGLPSMDADGKIPDNLSSYAPMIIEADGFAKVFPEHKYLIVEALRREGYACGMTGDGVNDAPALKRADVGIAVSGATDAARAAADIVLTFEGLSVIVTAIVVSREIFQRMKNFFNYRIAATLQLLCFFFISVFAFPPQSYADNICTGLPSEGNGKDGFLSVEQCDSYQTCDNCEQFVEFNERVFFSLPVLMLMLITVLNDGTLISIAYDIVVSSPQPEKWNLKVVFTTSVVLAGVALASSLLLVWGALDSWNPNGMFHKFGLPDMEYGQVITLIYLKVSLSDFLTLFSARTHGFFWTVRPSTILVVAAGISLTISTLLACFWPPGTLDGIPVVGLVRGGSYKLWFLWTWLYCIVFFLLQDSAKVLTYKVLEKYNIFNINTTKLVNARDAHSFDDPAKPHARESAGLVESKLVAMKVEDAEKAAAAGAAAGDAGLGRVSAQLKMARQSAQLARTSMTQGKAGDVEEGVNQVNETISRIDDALAGASGSGATAVRGDIEAAKEAAARLGRISAALQDPNFKG